MRRGLLSLLLVVLAMLAAVGLAEMKPEDVDDDLLVEEEETLETTDETDAKPVQEMDPRLTPDVIEKILSKSSAKCRKQIQENPTDTSKVSDRCRAEISSRVQRYLARLDKKENGETEDKKKNETPTKKTKKRRSRKSKKQTRAQRKAAAKQKKEEEYQKTLQTIVGFVVTLVVVIASAMFFINRKLKDAGMYFPDPDAKATCCN
ncbi:hypothetical protein DD238_000257 [Peronospora effusa]|uniref:RxLR effector protein n=1 Tax=Peronospora effusa TaxID=542832 RepID=A0A3M6VV55_9STRA|nr:hypothetical protein DD238_000257 [Peronospora effusa]